MDTDKISVRKCRITKPEPLCEPEAKTAWDTLNWEKTDRAVRKMQLRIADAFQKCEYEKLRVLIWLFTRSWAARLKAVQITVNARGSRTAGVDKILMCDSEDKYNAALSLSVENYAAKPYKRIYIPKGNGKTRPLNIPTLTDRIMQNLLKLCTDPLAECSSDAGSFGFRKFRRTQDAISACLSALTTGGPGEKWVLECDIKGCFDNIDHDWLIRHVPIDGDLMRKILKCGYVDMRLRKKNVLPIQAGVSQGSPLSPTLCNIALDGRESTAARTDGKVTSIRYADDVVVIGDSRETIWEIFSSVSEFLKPRGLELSEKKTFVTNAKDGFDFLGFFIWKNNGTAHVCPSLKSIEKTLHKIQRTVRASYHLDARDLIVKLNPLISGWGNYYRFTDAADTFGYMDLKITEVLWEWALWKTLDSDHGSVLRKYFLKTNKGYRFFGTGKRDDSGTSKPLYIASLSDRAGAHYVPLDPAANPFSDKWDPYFESRKWMRLHYDEKAQRRMDSIYLEQNGLCPVCGMRITAETGFAIHERKTPGKIGFAYTVVHPHCHEKLHRR
jgi:RNA-directed DNA polymerase